MHLGKKVDVIIYIEHVMRELEAAVLLQQRLKKEGLTSVVLPFHFNRYYHLLKYQSKAVVVPFFYSYNDLQISHLQKKYYRHQPIVINLHQEQISGPGAWQFMLPSDEASREVIHFAWGRNFAHKLLLSGCREDTIYETGSIRAEVAYLSALTRQYRPSSTRKRILVTLNFGFAYFSKDYLENIRKNGHPDSYGEQKRALESLAWFSDLLIKIIKSKPEYDFVLRPHPSDPPHAYRELRDKLRSQTNVTFSREGSIYGQLLEADAVLTWTSTSVIEAQLMNVPSACLIKSSDISKMDFIELWNHFERVEDVLDWFDAGFPTIRSMEQYLADVYGDYANASEITCQVIKNLILDKSYARLNPLSGFVYLIAKSVSVDLPKYLLYRLGMLSKVRPFYARIEERDLDIEDDLNVVRLSIANLTQR